MADLLSTSISGLLAFQQALDTTSENVTNVDTPGYSRETANLNSAIPQAFGTGWVGSGVDVTSITRSYDELLAQQVRSSQANYSSFNSYATQAAQVSTLLSDSNTGITAGLQNFVNALQTVANAPASTAQRQVLLSQAQTLATQLNSYDSQLSQYNSNIDSQVVNGVTEVNTLAGNIAQLNAQITAGTASTGQPPNTLLDQRDQLLQQLSQYVNVSTSTQSDGELNVYIGTGQSLVVGSTASQLSTVQNAFDPTRHDVVLSTSSGAVNITAQITGGSIGGLLAVRSQVVDPAINAIGRVSVGLASVVNQQQQSGMDLTGSLGEPMFAVGGVVTEPNSANTGTATVTTTRSNVNALTTDNYQLEMTSGGWQLQDASTGTVVPMSGTGTALDPLTAVGVSIVTSGTATVGDRFLIKPTAAATQGLSVLLTNPSQIAAASPIQTAAGASNTGSGSISAGQVTDPTNPQLQSTATIRFLTPSTYSINGSGSFAYTGGGSISANGWQVSISGAPAAGDTFTVSSNAGATGDNTNVLAMAAALGTPLFDSGTTSLSAAANNLVSQVGTLTQQAQNNSAAQQTVNQDATSALSNVSGVNLDQEAANLLQFQQAYQACAQLIQASSTMFTSLMTAITDG